MKVQDNARAEGNITILSGVDGGLGGRAVFRGTSRPGTSTLLQNFGAEGSDPGAEAVTQFLDDAVLVSDAVFP